VKKVRVDTAPATAISSALLVALIAGHNLLARGEETRTATEHSRQLSRITERTRLDLNENVSVFTTEHFFNGLLGYTDTVFLSFSVTQNHSRRS